MKMMRQFALSAMAALLVLCGIAPLGSAQTTPPSLAGQANSAPVAAHARLSPAPEFTLESPTGETVSLSGFRGKVVLLNFWATWCGPCKILTPWLVELQDQYGPQGLQIIGVALDEDATKVEIGEYADQMRVNYPVLIGNETVAKAYGGVPAMPESFLIGRHGKIVDRMVGLKSKGEIEGCIRKVLNTQAENTQADPPTGAALQPQK